MILALSNSGCTKMAIFTDSTFPELSGSYHYYNYTSWENGLYEISVYDSWDFDKTTKAWHYYNKWSYTENGWTNALKESKSFDMEWKVENGIFYTTYWDSDFDWVAHSFEYINTNSFILVGNLYEKD